ncbi:MAG TPA: hypothetical protein ENK11_09515 [Phycisphaerales bacterium]|nr:hypothetical protein [Phycisphaerales bacterium]
MADPYAIEPDPSAPRLPGQTVLREDEDAVLDTLAADIYVHALDCVRRFGDFHLAIGAGRFEQRLCVRLMTDPAVRLLPWNRAHLWAVRARRGDDGGTDFREIVELLADHAGLPEGRVHEPVFAGEDHASAYQAELREALAWREKGHDRLDVVVLTLSPSGVVEGIADAGDDEGGGVLVVPTGDTVGVSMSAALVNSARMVAIAATGAGVASVLREADRGAAPGGAVRPIGGALRWYIDRRAYPG